MGEPGADLTGISLSTKTLDESHLPRVSAKGKTVCGPGWFLPLISPGKGRLMLQWNPYLNFNGNCAEAFAFYEKCLGGKLVAMVPFSQMPPIPGATASDANKIMHARLVVGNQVLMGSDYPPGMTFQGVHGFSVAIQTDSPEEADRVFHALAVGGTVTMPLEKTFWAVRFGMLVDRFGIPWMINCEKAEGA